MSPVELYDAELAEVVGMIWASEPVARSFLWSAELAEELSNPLGDGFSLDQQLALEGHNVDGTFFYVRGVSVGATFAFIDLDPGWSRQTFDNVWSKLVGLVDEVIGQSGCRLSTDYDDCRAYRARWLGGCHPELILQATHAPGQNMIRMDLGDVFR